jgi:hypothetical protein
MKEWVIYVMYLLMGLVLGSGLTLLFMEDFYTKQLVEFRHELEKDCMPLVVPFDFGR